MTPYEAAKEVLFLKQRTFKTRAQMARMLRMGTPTYESLECGHFDAISEELKLLITDTIRAYFPPKDEYLRAILDIEYDNDPIPNYRRVREPHISMY